MDYAPFLTAGIKIAKEAGEVVRAAFYQPKKIEFKENANDMVTETDKKSEEIIIAGLKKQFPDHTFLGEEGTSAGQMKEILTDAPTWIIDPIDGTTNFVHRYPFIAISIGFSINKEVVVGVVFNPILNELFYASKGNGAFLNETKLQASPTQNLQESLVGLGFPYNRADEVVLPHLDRIHRVLKQCREIRRGGSAALDMCSVAAGRLEIYFEYGIHAWDVAAGSIIVQEAGGVVTDPDVKWEEDKTENSNSHPPVLDICQRKVIAGGNPVLTKLFLGLLHQK